MIDSLSVENFKCFVRKNIPLSSLTVLTGYNAAGKSTTIQPLLLMSQYLKHGGGASFLSMNGPLVKLGTVGEVISYNTQGDINFTIRSGAEEVQWILAPSDVLGGEFLEFKQATLASASGERRTCNNSAWPAFEHGAELKEYIRNLIFVSSSRSSQDEAFSSPNNASISHANVGASGEYAPWWYVRMADELVDEAKRHPIEEAVTVRGQIDAWMSDLFPGVSANADTLRKTRLTRLGFKVGRTSDWLRPSNVGYGLSYVFPIIVALVCAKPSQILVIDSPEAHLHPRAQSQFGRILAHFAASGLQLIVETHSDHILSGIRLGVREGTIMPNKITIHFFNNEEDALQLQVQQLRIDKTGAIDAWPSGFFDQSELDLASLAGWGPQ